jgi:aspartokinase/homoserine dehydrogenase 1
MKGIILIGKFTRPFLFDKKPVFSINSMDPCLVIKFGGTSVGTAEAMGQAVQIVKTNHQVWTRLVVITSALAGVTDILLKSALRASEGDSQTYSQAAIDLHRMHERIAHNAIVDPAPRNQVLSDIDRLLGSFSNLCQAIAILGEATPRALDAVASLGERLSVRLLTAALESNGLPSRFLDSTGLITTDDHFQSAHPDFQVTAQNVHQILNPLFSEGIIPVITGFIGATRDGTITTLGRGGSDYSAAVIGAVLPADEVWIYTDVDGVMSADPRLVPDARTIPVLSYKEVAELAYYGAKVLHPKTIRPIIDAGIGLRVVNTFNPTHPGTRLVAENEQSGARVVKAVTAIRKQQLVTIEGRGMLGVPGVAARAFSTVAATGTSVTLISQASSEQSICFTTPMESTLSVLDALKKTFSQEIECQDIDRIWATDEVAIITVVGSGMRNTPGVAGLVFGALGNHNVNVIAIAQGSSEVSISILVDASQTQAAVKAIHALIID